jgi:hypothetical protein
MALRAHYPASILWMDEGRYNIGECTIEGEMVAFDKEADVMCKGYRLI